MEFSTVWPTVGICSSVIAIISVVYYLKKKEENNVNAFYEKMTYILNEEHNMTVEQQQMAREDFNIKQEFEEIGAEIEDGPMEDTGQMQDPVHQMEEIGHEKEEPVHVMEEYGEEMKEPVQEIEEIEQEMEDTDLKMKEPVQEMKEADLGMKEPVQDMKEPVQEIKEIGQEMVVHKKCKRCQSSDNDVAMPGTFKNHLQQSFDSLLRAAEAGESTENAMRELVESMGSFVCNDREDVLETLDNFFDTVAKAAVTEDDKEVLVKARLVFQALREVGAEPHSADEERSMTMFIIKMKNKLVAVGLDCTELGEYLEGFFMVAETNATTMKKKIDVAKARLVFQVPNDEIAECTEMKMHQLEMEMNAADTKRMMNSFFPMHNESNKASTVPPTLRIRRKRKFDLDSGFWLTVVTNNTAQIA